MAWSQIQSVWPVLIIVAYLAIMNMLRVLSAYCLYEFRLHDRICDSREMHRKYLEGIEHQ